MTYNPLKRRGAEADSGSVRLEGILRTHRGVAMLDVNGAK